MSKRNSVIGTAMIIAILTFLLSIPVFAQENENQPQKSENSLKGGAWALQFQLGSAFSRRSSQGFAVCGKYHLSESKAVRVGFDLGGSFSFGKNVNRGGDVPDDTLRSYNNNDYSLQDIDMTLEYLSYKSIRDDISVFWGTGPIFGFRHSKSSVIGGWYYGQEFRTFTNTNEYYSWGFGISTVLGAEWFPTKRISIVAEYGASFKYSYVLRKTVRTNKNLDEIDRIRYHNNYFSANLLSSRMGIAVYF